MSVFSLYAMPNHLRPSTSYKSLSKGLFETPKTFTDRIYLTDVADTLRQVISSNCGDASIKILWRRSYFPWRIRIKLYGGTILLTGKVYGESSWASAITMQFKNLDGVLNTHLKTIIEQFVGTLGRLPYESPYWTDETWQKFSRAHKLSRNKVETDWSKYIEVLGNID
ncbi:MAG: hypothetical protein JSV49_04140 [Thermoplasmata archaeon]|nr:MAG: hypothetical protein JSV49_04140 [Thermoplasmata archaeon]